MEARVKELLDDAKAEWMVKVKEDMIEPLERIINQPDLGKRIEELEKWKMDTENKYKDKEKGKESMTNRKGFSNIPGYNGKPEDYDDWAFKMRTFLNEEVDFKEVLIKLDKFNQVPTKEEVFEMFQEIEDDADHNVSKEWINHQLYQVLCMNLEGKALSYVKNLNDPLLKDMNGIIGWIKLALQRTAMTSERLQGLADKVYAPKRCKKYSEVSAAIEDWELSVSLFEKTEDITISPQTRIYSIRKLVPEELEKDIIRSDGMKTFEAVRKYINEQVTVRRDHKSSSSGPVQMDVNYVKKTLASMVGEDEGQECQEGAHEDYDGIEYGEDDGKTALDYILSFVKGQKGGKGTKGKGKFSMEIATFVVLMGTVSETVGRKTKKPRAKAREKMVVLACSTARRVKEKDTVLIIKEEKDLDRITQKVRDIAPKDRVAGKAEKGMARHTTLVTTKR